MGREKERPFRCLKGRGRVRVYWDGDMPMNFVRLGEGVLRIHIGPLYLCIGRTHVPSRPWLR